MKMKTFVGKMVDDFISKNVGFDITENERQTVLSCLERYRWWVGKPTGGGIYKNKKKKLKKLKRTFAPTIVEILSDKSKYRTHYLKHPIWKEQRSHVVEENRAKNDGIARCEACRATEVTSRLDPHHMVYRKRNMMNPSCTKDVIMICRPCHDLIHNYVGGGMPLRKATDVVIALNTPK